MHILIYNYIYAVFPHFFLTERRQSRIQLHSNLINISSLFKTNRAGPVRRVPGSGAAKVNNDRNAFRKHLQAQAEQSPGPNYTGGDAMCVCFVFSFRFPIGVVV